MLGRGEGRQERRHKITTHSESLSEFLCNWKVPWLCFRGDDLVTPAFKLCGKVFLTPFSYLILDGNKNFLLVYYCQPPDLSTSCAHCLRDVKAALESKTELIKHTPNV